MLTEQKIRERIKKIDIRLAKISIHAVVYNDRTVKRLGRKIEYLKSELEKTKSIFSEYYSCLLEKWGTHRKECRDLGAKKRENLIRLTKILHGTHTTQEWENLKKEVSFRCVRCNKRARLTKDHIRPIIFNGKNKIENIQPLCSPCNSSKSANEKNYLTERRKSNGGK